MKQVLITLFIAILCAPAFADESKELVKVYCTSEDLEAGFKDDSAEFFCRELGKRGEKKKSLALSDNRENAEVIVMYLGVEEITTKGETTHLMAGYAWTPDQAKNGARAVITIGGLGGFTKGFHATGVNAAAPMGAMRLLENWIRENRETILKKASEQK